MNTPSLADMRKNYQQAELLESNAAKHPLQQFTTWLNQALEAEIPEPNAMTLATVSSSLRPSTRVVLIKGYDEQGIVWFTNYNSRKGHELAGNPFAALQFHWVELERVVRIEGRVEKISEAESDTYYHSRPLASRIGAWASPQSQTIASREWLQDELKNYADKFQQEPPRPPHWGGYRLVPDTWEFWQGGGARLHDRLQYSLTNGQWLMQRLAP
jgi:pyridoxamine 5'-phosphate oxidase